MKGLLVKGLTLAEVFHEGGYRAYMAWKWHLGEEPEHRPHARGLERSFRMLQGSGSHKLNISLRYL